MSLRIIIYFCSILIIYVLGKIQRIVGGKNVIINNVPYMVSLRYDLKHHFCGGAIISDWHILTAAHCFADKLEFLDQVTIHTGSSSSRQSRWIFKLMHVDMAERYQLLDQSIDDIAIVTLQTSIKFNTFQNKINLPSEDVQAGKSGVVCGWGTTTHPTDVIPELLQKATMKIVEKSKCVEFLDGIEYTGRFCAFQKIGVGICVGDSGSPLVADGKVVGISSFVVPCATGEPDVFTNVFQYLDFIKLIMSKYP